MTDRDLVFLDTETLGLAMDAPIWEIAAIRRDNHTGIETELHIFVDHNHEPWLPDLPIAFADDFVERFNPDAALPQLVAAAAVFGFITAGRGDRPPTLVGCNPRFDADRIEHQLLSPAGYPTPWHYSLLDTATLARGYLHGTRSTIAQHRRDVPHTSDALSEAIGINPERYDRHTAMGDAQWCRDQYDLITGTRNIDTITADRDGTR